MHFLVHQKYLDSDRFHFKEELITFQNELR